MLPYLFNQSWGRGLINKTASPKLKVRIRIKKKKNRRLYLYHGEDLWRKTTRLILVQSIWSFYWFFKTFKIKWKDSGAWPLILLSEGNQWQGFFFTLQWQEIPTLEEMDSLNLAYTAALHIWVMHIWVQLETKNMHRKLLIINLYLSWYLFLSHQGQNLLLGIQTGHYKRSRDEIKRLGGLYWWVLVLGWEPGMSHRYERITALTEI